MTCCTQEVTARLTQTFSNHILAIFGKVLTIERVQTDRPPTSGVCSLAGFVRAGDAFSGLGWQVSPRCQWVPALVLVSPQSFAFPISQSTKITPRLDFCTLQTMCRSPFCSPSSNRYTVPLQVPCTGTGLQTPLPDCWGVKSLFLCTREVSGGNPCS